MWVCINVFFNEFRTANRWGHKKIPNAFVSAIPKSNTVTIFSRFSEYVTVFRELNFVVTLTY